MKVTETESQFSRAVFFDPSGSDDDKPISRFFAPIRVYQEVNESGVWENCKLHISANYKSIEAIKTIVDAVPVAIGVAEKWNAERAGKEYQHPAPAEAA